MINISKLHTAFRLLRRNPQGFISALFKSYRKWFLSTRREPFTYNAPHRHRMVCFPEWKMSTKHYTDGASESLECSIARSWLKPCDLCIDAGVSCGYYSFLMADRVGNNGQVLSIEPSPETVRHVHQAIEMLGYTDRISFFECALWNQSGQTSFYTSKSKGHKDYAESIKPRSIYREQFQKVEVPCITLSEILGKYSQSPSMIKIDIEGAEYHALSGRPEELLRINPPLVILELCRGALETFGSSVEALLELFSDENYLLYYVNRVEDANYGCLFQLTVERMPEIFHANLIAIPRVGEYAKRIKDIKPFLP